MVPGVLGIDVLGLCMGFLGVLQGFNGVFVGGLCMGVMGFVRGFWGFVSFCGVLSFLESLDLLYFLGLMGSDGACVFFLLFLPLIVFPVEVDVLCFKELEDPF